MAQADWNIRGLEVVNCNCAYGCPCQFNALPTSGDCRGVIAMHIASGRFGDIPLDGLNWVLISAWPGAIHHGRGEMQPIIDERADERQREALLKILSGEEADAGTFFNILASTMERIHPPMFRPIAFAVDLDARRARLSIPGVLEAETAPIRNPVTGEPHRARITLPGGFEYIEAEVADARARAEQPIRLDLDRNHAHIAAIHLSSRGVVRGTAPEAAAVHA